MIYQRILQRQQNPQTAVNTIYKRKLQRQQKRQTAVNTSADITVTTQETNSSEYYEYISADITETAKETNRSDKSSPFSSKTK